MKRVKIELKMPYTIKIRRRFLFLNWTTRRRASNPKRAAEIFSRHIGVNVKPHELSGYLGIDFVIKGSKTVTISKR